MPSAEMAITLVPTYVITSLLVAPWRSAALLHTGLGTKMLLERLQSVEMIALPMHARRASAGRTRASLSGAAFITTGL